MAIKKKKISEYPEGNSFIGLWTLGYNIVANGAKQSVKVSLEFIKTAIDNAIKATNEATQATENAITSTNDANSAKDRVNTATKDAITATNNANTATIGANTATEAANNIVGSLNTSLAEINVKVSKNTGNINKTQQNLDAYKISNVTSWSAQEAVNTSISTSVNTNKLDIVTKHDFAIKHIDDAINTLVGLAPEELNSIWELAHAVAGNQDVIEVLNTAIADKEPAFPKKPAFNKDFGTSLGTVCQGNDERLSDDRPPTTHNHNELYYQKEEVDEEIDNLEIGGVNLINGSANLVNGGAVADRRNYFYKTSKTAPLPVGTYTFSVEELGDEPLEAEYSFTTYYADGTSLGLITFGRKLTFTTTKKTNGRMSLYLKYGVLDLNTPYRQEINIKLEKGNKSTSCSPSIKDTQAEIADAKQEGTNAMAAISSQISSHNQSSTSHTDIRKTITSNHTIAIQHTDNAINTLIGLAPEELNSIWELAHAVAGNQDVIEVLNTAIIAKEPIFSKNTAFNKNFGTTSGTVCKGDDPRLSDDRPPTTHNHNELYYQKAEVDDKIAKIPTPDVSSQISSHNQGSTSHVDIRGLIASKEDRVEKNSAYNRDFGIKADSVCRGNDARLSDDRPPIAHSHDILYYKKKEIDSKFTLTSTDINKVQENLDVYKVANADTWRIQTDMNVAYADVINLNRSNITIANTAIVTNHTIAIQHTDNAINTLVGLAPEELNSIWELAHAVAGNQDVVEVLNNAITQKSDKSHTHSYLPTSGGTITGSLYLNGNWINGYGYSGVLLMDANYNTFLGSAEQGKTVTIRGGGGINAVSFYRSSDKRLKTNIKAIDPSVIEKSILLNPVEFNWKNDATKKQYGFIAQEVELLIPEVVSTNDKGIKSVDYDALQNIQIAYLMREIKELRTELKILKDGTSE